MIEVAELALSFVRDRKREDLDTDAQLRLALTHAVDVVGEAATQVGPVGRAELPEILWQQIIGMRNRLIHAYFDINLNILWDTVQLALPPLLQPLRRALEGA